MKIFVAHSFSENLNEKYYEQICSVFKILDKKNHSLFVGGLHVKLQDVYDQLMNPITCYSIVKYEEEKKYSTTCNYIVTENPILRTNALINATDCALFLPGGSGTLAEFFSVLESYKASDEKKKIYLVNINHHYDLLLDYLHFLNNEQFNQAIDLELIQVITMEDIKKI